VQLRLLTLLNESLSLQATIDPLTNLYNRRELYHRLSVEWARYQRHARPLSLILLDIDHFKEVNDTYGHECGDVVLRTLGLLMRSNVRMQDMVFRYGGEEFVVVLPETPLLAAFQVAENLRARVAAHRFFCGANVVPIHISLGVAGVKEQGLASEEALIKQADQSMYRAKQSGRNRTVVLDGQDPDKILYQTMG
jgi:diguanylate cyclase (GGDEF)-like protein